MEYQYLKTARKPKQLKKMPTKDYQLKEMVRAGGKEPLKGAAKKPTGLLRYRTK